MIGQTISHYKILEKLGEGGMGVVYKAEDTKLKRMVAIKFLPKHLAVHGDERDRFVLEAQAASALNHPNVATIYEIDEAEGESFIVMEYVEGRTLRESREGLSARQVTDIGIQLAEGLAAAHEKGIVHRDVKPENVMLRKDGRAQLMDFGLAKLRGVSKLTKTGSTIGTIAYMSPEQVQGIETDHRTDIFSLGVLLYELLTGELPFKGGHEAAVMYEIVNVEPAPLSSVKEGIDPELQRIIMKCLEKDRDERYQTVKEVAVDLKRLRRDSEGRRMERRSPSPGTVQTPPDAGEAAVMKPRRGFPAWIKIAAPVVLLGLGALVVWLFMRPSGGISQNMIFKPLQVPFTTIFYPGLSSDGNWIAFPATDENNVTEIYYMHVSGGEPRRVTNDSLWKFSCDISPDGSEIVYTRGVSRLPLTFPLQILTVSALGGQPRKIVDAGNAPRWSPDGASIAYVTRGPKGGVALGVCNADGSDRRFVLEDSLGQRVSLAWSPDGRSIAWLRTFREGTNPYQEIIVHDLETGKERQITNDRKNIDEVYWMPQGEILYSSNREGPSNLWAIPSAGGTPLQITRGPGPDLGIKASRDGKRVLYMEQATYGAVVVADLDGTNARQITPDDRSAFAPACSPDGNEIAFLVNDPDPIKSATYIYLVGRDGHNRRQLTEDNQRIENFAWSPDGRRIAYTVHVDSEVDSAHKTFVLNLSDPTRRTFVANGRVFQWMKDGASLNILSNGTSWKVQVDGGSREPIDRDSTLVLQSPDGHKLLVADSRTGVSIKEDGKAPLHLPQINVVRPPLWLPDGKSLVVLKGSELLAVSATTGRLQPYVWNNSDAVRFDGFTPDGKHTVFVKPRTSSKLILIDNFH